MSGIKNDNIPKTYTGDGTTISVSGNVISAIDPNQLGEIKMFALSLTGAVTKATLQGKGWAICDGTTPAAQGISSPTITTTPNLEHKFIRMSDDESSGNSGGSETHNHQWHTRSTAGSDTSERIQAFAETFSKGKSYNASGSEINFTAQGGDWITGEYYTTNTDTKPPYYELAFFLKVK